MEGMASRGGDGRRRVLRGRRWRRWEEEVERGEDRRRRVFRRRRWVVEEEIGGEKIQGGECLGGGDG